MKSRLPHAFFLLLAFSSIPFSQLENITAGLTSLCSFVSDLLPVVAMTLVVCAGGVYAGGQLMGAETRARANVWATTLLTGALVGILISVVSPTVLGAMYGPTWDDSCAQGGLGGGFEVACAGGMTECQVGATLYCCDPATETCDLAIGCVARGPCTPNPCGARTCCLDAGLPNGYYCTNGACA